MDFGRQTDPASFLAHVNQNPAAFLLNLPERCVQLIATVASARSEDIAGKTLTVHAHQRRLVLVDVAFHERKMVLAIKLRPIQMQIEIAVLSRQLYDLLELHELFPETAVSDQTLDGTNAQSMFFVELHQLWQTGHGAVIVQDLAKNSRWLQACHTCHVDRGFGMSCPSQHAAIFGT